MLSLKASQFTRLFHTIVNVKKTGNHVTYVIADLVVWGLATFFRTFCSKGFRNRRRSNVSVGTALCRSQSPRDF